MSTIFELPPPGALAAAFDAEFSIPPSIAARRQEVEKALHIMSNCEQAARALDKFLSATGTTDTLRVPSSLADDEQRAKYSMAVIKYLNAFSQLGEITIGGRQPFPGFTPLFLPASSVLGPDGDKTAAALSEKVKDAVPTRLPGSDTETSCFSEVKDLFQLWQKDGSFSNKEMLREAQTRMGSILDSLQRSGVQGGRRAGWTQRTRDRLRNLRNNAKDVLAAAGRTADAKTFGKLQDKADAAVAWGAMQRDRLQAALGKEQVDAMVATTQAGVKQLVVPAAQLVKQDIGRRTRPARTWLRDAQAQVGMRLGDLITTAGHRASAVISRVGAAAYGFGESGATRAVELDRKQQQTQASSAPQH